MNLKVTMVAYFSPATLSCRGKDWCRQRFNYGCISTKLSAARRVRELGEGNASVKEHLLTECIKFSPENVGAGMHVGHPGRSFQLLVATIVLELSGNVELEKRIWERNIKLLKLGRGTVALGEDWKRQSPDGHQHVRGQVEKRVRQKNKTKNSD